MPEQAADSLTLASHAGSRHVGGYLFELSALLRCKCPFQHRLQVLRTGQQAGQGRDT